MDCNNDTRFNLDTYSAVLFDLDGVLTPTTDIHMRAWSEMFNDFLATQRIDKPYTLTDYFAYVDGKPRYEGVKSFLDSRGIDLPYGHPDDPDDAATICGLGNRKNSVFLTVLARDGIDPYPGSLALVRHLHTTHIEMAVVSSSRNAHLVLKAAGLDQFFDVVVDGLVSKAYGLAGKPAPDGFLYAAQQLGVRPESAAVFEDALSGVQAGSAGEFGLVVGVDRGAGAQALRDAGAHLVVKDVQEMIA